MRLSYKVLSLFAVMLLGFLFQQCTHDIPAPAPAPTQNTPANRFAAAIARGDVHAKYEKAPATAQTKTGQTQAGTGTGTTSKLAQPVCYDYYVVYYDNTGAEVGRDFLYTDCPGEGTGGGGGSDGGTGGGGTGPYGSTPDPSGLSPNAVVLIPPTTPVQNVRDFLKCLTISQSATLAVYAAQPRPGTDATWAGNPLSPRVGHAFLSITQNGITRVLGFYPTSSISFVQDASGIIGDDSNHDYSVRISTTISPSQLANMLTYIYGNSNATYVLPDYNCSDFLIGAAGAAGLYLPDTYGQWGGISGGTNPGNLGQDMRNMSLPAGATRTLSGTAPSNSGGC